MDERVNSKVEVEIEQNTGFPVAAIVVLAVGGYILIFALLLIVRKVCLAKDHTFCPSWCAEICLCTSCCEDACPCLPCLEKCTCGYPNKRCFMDAVCPTKQWCDDVCCCCLSQEPEGRCKCFNTDDCNCCNSCACSNDCDEICECQSCKDCYDDCKCQCCATPETCDCCCFEIKLNTSSQRANRMSMNGGGGAGDMGGGNIMAGGYGMMPPGIINQQPLGQSSRFDNQRTGYANPQQQLGFSQPAGYYNRGQQQQGGLPLGQSLNYNQQLQQQMFGQQQQMFGARYNQQASFQEPGVRGSSANRASMFSAS